MSTRTPSSFSSDLNGNVTGLETTVFSAASYSPTISPTDFNLVFDFSGSPFLYNPQHGNLLLDMAFGGITYSVGVGFNPGVGLRAGSVFSAAQTAMTSWSDVETIPTRFDYTPAGIPEPSCGILALLGATSMTVFSRKRNC